jgi:hypothetical protein
MCIKILSISAISLFWGLSTASFSAEVRCYELLDEEFNSPSFESKKRQRTELQNHDSLDLGGVEQLAGEAHNLLRNAESAGFLDELKQEKTAKEPETKKRVTKKSVKFNPTMELLSFDNKLVEDGEGWVQYIDTLEKERETQGRRSKSNVLLGTPLLKAIHFPKNILEAPRVPDRQNIEDRRAAFLAFKQISEAKSQLTHLQHQQYLQDPKNDPVGCWLAKYAEAHATAKELFCKFEEKLFFRDGLVERAYEIIREQQADPSNTHLNEEYVDIIGQILWYEQKLIMMSEAYGKVQHCILAAIGVSRSEHDLAGLEAELMPVFISNVKHALCCSLRLPSFVNKEYFHMLSSSFLNNLQSLILVGEYEKASSYLAQFNDIFMNNIRDFHNQNIPSTDHPHGEFGPCQECETLCPDCIELLRNLKEKKEVVSRLLKEIQALSAQETKKI